MSTQRYALTVGFALFTALALSLGAEEQTNLVVNGDMEITTATGWSVNKPEDATCVIRSVDAPFKNGTRALLLEGKGAWMSANSAQVSIHPGKRYRATAWLRTKKGHAYLQFDHFENGKWMGSQRAASRVVKDEWTAVSVESDQAKYPNATHVSVGIVSDGPEVEVYADDVVMSAVVQKAE